LKEDVLKPINCLGGITYGRVIHGFEIPRPMFKRFSHFPLRPFLMIIVCPKKIKSMSNQK